MKLAALVLAVPALAAGGAAPSPAAPNVPRAVHTATLLASGDVLLVGGCTVDGCELDERGATTEIFDAKTHVFRPGPPLRRPRDGHGAVRLADASVLVFGGWTGNIPTTSAERWRPGADRFDSAAPMRTPRGGFTAHEAAGRTCPRHRRHRRHAHASQRRALRPGSRPLRRNRIDARCSRSPLGDAPP